MDYDNYLGYFERLSYPVLVSLYSLMHSDACPISAILDSLILSTGLVFEFFHINGHLRSLILVICLLNNVNFYSLLLSATAIYVFLETMME